ncbi:alpha-ketoglutarate-dependent dioxygenase AlkB [Luteolibacter flavescens]|uniref:Alpha-ketoglutarate-dependent dioxygenase AlkB n=1 Tax=Luteolibacter flavescens TaxID=1859460 RepID=A0ABT3FIF1_9BACT|nr:alpha-ketoglutarate-dependent dioxygenase AlkB [Luteolibacter flavescens]MCW1883344.1 alpha-ketoglutarate-dependent dioxygenase AlkB [Luteolibacter flavescens]
MNLLPKDGTVVYHGRIFDEVTSRNYYERLSSSIPWRHDEVVMFGKRIVTAREVAWFADAGIPYRYSGTVKQAIAWTDELAELKYIVEGITGLSFNSCLANLYHHGGEGMSWHSDDEKALLKRAGIASLSFGAERDFAFRHKLTAETISLRLVNGSLLVMKDETQEFWKHALPKAARIKEPRINLTFRTMAGL